MDSPKKLSRLILLFSISYVLIILCPDFLDQDFYFLPSLRNEDVVAPFAPFLIVLLYWLMHEVKKDLLLARTELFLFLIAAIGWTFGFGMHWAANAIGRLLRDQTTTEVYRLTYFLDEILGHYFWSIFAQLMTVLILIRQWKNPFQEKLSSFKLELIAGLLYGISYAITTIEGQTVPIGIPFAALITGFAIHKGASLRTRPLLAFYAFSYSFALIFFLVWGLYWKGFPELSALGWIH